MATKKQMLDTFINNKGGFSHNNATLFIICHPKGGRYRVLGKIKFKHEGVWHEGISYQDLDDFLIYARAYDDFESFTIEKLGSHNNVTGVSYSENI